MRTLGLALFLCLCLGLAPAQAQTACRVPADFPGTPIVSAAAEGSHILKAAPGCLIAAYVTTAASAGLLMVFNSTTVPGDGAVTPIHCIPVAASSSQFVNFAPQPPEWYSTGIVVAFSTGTNCFNKAISTTAFFHAIVQ